MTSKEIRIVGNDVEIIDGNVRVVYTAVDHPLFSRQRVAETILRGLRKHPDISPGLVRIVLLDGATEADHANAPLCDMRDAVKDISTAVEWADGITSYNDYRR